MAKPTNRSSSSAGAPPPPTTEDFQKHYGRGAGYPEIPRHGHAPPPPPPHNYHHHSPHYASSQHPPLPPLPPGHRGHSSHPSHHYAPPPPSWYYPTSDRHNPSSSSSRGAAKSSIHPSLVTPKSHDSETLPPLNAAPNNKRSPPKSTAKKVTSKNKMESKIAATYNNNPDKEAEIEEDELQVDPMKQDFHFYATDNYKTLKPICEKQLDKSYSNGTIPASKSTSKDHLYLLTTLLNARLIQNWETVQPSTRDAYLKKEESDRKRFMSEEEVASRHCATLTARRRSPKQSGTVGGGLGRAGSFGLSATVPRTGKREAEDGAINGGSMKRVKV